MAATVDSPPAAYDHSQFGWPLLFIALPIVFATTALGTSAHNQGVLVVVLVLMLAILPVFGWLRVTVDERALTASFGVGLIKRREALADMRAWSAVRNSWLHGWGIRMVPGGWMYNISGLSAVELILADGRRLRIGTDEPDALMRALELATGRPSDDTAKQTRAPKRKRGVLFAAGLIFGVLPLLSLPFAFHHFEQPPEVRVEADTLTIDTPFFGYGDNWHYRDVTHVELLQRLPQVQLRTNGYALGSTLRGWFLLEGLGEGKLFVEAGQPPYVHLALREGYVIVNYEDPDKTRRLYDDLLRAAHTHKSTSP